MLILAYWVSVTRAALTRLLWEEETATESMETRRAEL